MLQFLDKVAKVFAEKEATYLFDYCFVVPNRRSATFLKHFFTSRLSSPQIILPRIVDISSFIEEITSLVTPNRVQELLLLYGVYCEQFINNPDRCVSFDRFLYWGDMILNDFNDVDLYMIGAEELFKNVENYKDIKSDVLDDNQKKAISQFFNVPDSFLKSNDDSLFVKKQYQNLWNLLFPMYVGLRNELRTRGLAYNGMNYRIAAEIIDNKSAEDFDFKKVIFVGFSTLSTSEFKIFKSFQAKGIADYYWDMESPLYEKVGVASKFISQYIKEFKSFYDINDNQLNHWPQINIVSVPSGAGQAKVLNSLLNQLADNKEIDVTNAIDTAIVMPEEKYANSVLCAIPQRFVNLNVTMGMPLKQSSIASLISALSGLDAHKRISDEYIEFYYEDVASVAEHPFIRMIYGSDVDTLLKEITEHNAFMVSETIVPESIKEVFGKSIEMPLEYLENIIDRIYSAIIESDNIDKIELFFVERYRCAINQIHDYLVSYSYGASILKGQSVFFILSKAMSGIALPLEGEPLGGLQMMGVLETRALDFRNVFVLSMNEKIFPSKHYTRSFIPEFLRHFYGLSTYRRKDTIYAYYFYRMISRAENVWLLYDARVQGISSGERSRYIQQLEYAYKTAGKESLIKEFYYDFSKYASRSNDTLRGIKTERVMNILNRYRTPNSGKYLSASSINTFINCPFRFYLEYIEGYPEEKNVTDFIDDSTMGTIVHEVLQHIYDQYKDYNAERINSELNDLRTHPYKIKKFIIRSINKNYIKIKDCDRELTGESVVICSIVLHFVMRVINHDISLKDLTYVSSEEKLKIEGWDLCGENLKFNFKCVIDRVDKIKDNLRIVDYKTGGDTVEFSKVKSLFYLKSNRPKAILQVMLYCHAYRHSHNFDRDIIPSIYNLRNNKYAISQSNKVLYGYESYSQDFIKEMSDVISKLFDEEPFNMTNCKEHCIFCQFNDLCGRKKS